MLEKDHKIKQNKWIVVTSIHSPSVAIQKIAELCHRDGWSAVVVGDKKTPKDWECGNIVLLSVEEQAKIFGKFSEQIPYNHYCRKNLGYLYALSQGADLILETDDDNIPLPSFGKNLAPQVQARQVQTLGQRWVNVYGYFTDEKIWPRGLPLNEITSALPNLSDGLKDYPCPIQQYLADRDPDVDAIYRLIFKDPVQFKNVPSVVLPEGAWVPFNSQNTLFYEEAYPLLYLPCFVSFRMTDIWRSFVAQAALWVHDSTLAFHSPTVEQIRNEHNLMKDFRDEVVGYLNNEKIATVLWEGVQTLKTLRKSNPGLSMAQTCGYLWKSLVAHSLIPKEELPLIEGWLSHFKKAKDAQDVRSIHDLSQQ